jgi:hypothetical protein
MVIIRLPSGADWYKANWAFRQLAEDIRRRFTEDKAVAHEFEKAQAMGALFLDDIDKDLGKRVVVALKTVAEETIGGKIGGWKRTHPADEAGQRMYLEALAELLSLLKAEDDV